MAFSQVGLFLDQPFRGISLRYFRSDLFISFGFSSKVSFIIVKAREKLTKRGKKSHTEKCIKGMPLLHLHMWKVQRKRMELWEDQFKE